MFKKLLFLLLIPSLAQAATQQNTAVRWSFQTLTVTSASAYTAGDSVGGLITFSGVTCPTSHNGRIISVQVFDLANNAVAYDLVLFSAAPTTSTITNKTAFALTQADWPNALPDINLATTDHFTYTTSGQSSLSSLGSSAYSTTTTPIAGILYGVLVTGGTPTFTGTGSVAIKTGFQCD